MSWVVVAVAGAGLVKAETVDKDKENRDRKLAAATQRYSPWTGLKAGPIKEADPLGSTLQGGMAGATFSQQNGGGGLGGLIKGGGTAAPSTSVNVATSNSDMSKPVDWETLFQTKNRSPYWSLGSGGQ